MPNTDESAAADRAVRGCCVLHLGMPKTASTVLQNELFARHSQVLPLGKYRTGVETLGFPNPGVRAFAEALASADLDPTPHRRLFDSLIEPALHQRRVPVWSRENMTRGEAPLHVQRARMFRDVFGPCKVMIFLRHPVSFAESMYFQGLRELYLHRIRAIDRKRSRQRAAVYRSIGLRSWYVDIEQWLNANWRLPRKGELGHLLAVDTAEGYAEVFGKENVRFFVFEEFVADRPKVLGELCRFMSIDASEALTLLSGKRWNERWSTRQIDALKALDRDRWRGRLLRLLPSKYGYRALALDEAGQRQTGPEARAEIPAVWQERLLEWTRDHTERLIRDWGVPLDRFGYAECHPGSAPPPSAIMPEGAAASSR